MKDLSLCRNLGDADGEVWLSAHFIDAYILAGRLADAIQIGEDALALARRRNDHSAEVWVRWHLALAYRAGRFSAALTALEAAVSDARDRQDLEGLTHMLTLLGEHRKTLAGTPKPEPPSMKPCASHRASASNTSNIRSPAYSRN